MNTCCVIGLGYIGLPTAALLSDSGLEVLGVDINKNVVDIINKGDIHIEEPNLKEIVVKNVNKGTLKASSKPMPADVFLISVATPIDTSGQEPKPVLDFVYKAIQSILPCLEKGNIVILESTCPVGTTEEILTLIKNYTGLQDRDIHLAYCPERVLPGNIVNELKSNDRVIGGINKISSNKVKEFYEKICNGNIFCTTSKLAELVKLTENSYRDLNIAFANEISLICDKLNENVYELIELANHHPRVNILKPGCGVGGHCIAVDPWFLISMFGSEAKIIKKAREVNDLKSDWVINKISTYVKNNLYKKKIKLGIFGMSFKPNVGDIRESPALKIIEELNKEYNLIICDPNIKYNSKFKLYSIEDTVKGSDLLIFLVGHDQFIGLDFSDKEILDFCGIYA
tara:strand:- start:595 stop:1791 length:1197 start_codon:yes stop_codon:yes gene_type:complete